MENIKIPVEALSRSIESQYGVRSKLYHIWEKTDRVPNEVLDRYLDLLKRKNVKFLKILQSENEISIIRYVDICTRNDDDGWFYKEYRDIFDGFQNDRFEVSVKRKILGSPDWESLDAIPYLTDLTNFYSYLCFPADRTAVVSAVWKKHYSEAPEITLVPDVPGWAFILQIECDYLLLRYKYPKIHRTPAVLMLRDNGIPVLEIKDRWGKFEASSPQPVLDESTRYKKGFRIDIDQKVRSSWEANIARILKLKNITYEYERERFDLGNELYYVPDFFLPNNSIIEVKGFWSDASRKKVATLQKNLPEYTIFPVDCDMYDSLVAKYADKIPDWEHTEKTYAVTEDVSIVGMKFCASKETLKNLAKGDSVIFEREPNNKYDRNSILVRNLNGDPIGHICGDWAAVYAPKIDIGMTYQALITSIQPTSIHISVKRSNMESEILYDFFK